ncbi:MAG TPA: T9SS type A sorting domain-containing protein, partial [Bacteroidales bacterium]|nr:T9SS type A sorting domain-containing protein [Bacteroidales bacterium]
MYHLIGIAEPELGFQNITAREIFDIHPGDELHIGETNSMMGPNGYYQYSSIINKYLGRDFINNDDTLLFTIERCQRTEYNQFDGNSQSYTVNASKDTVTQKIVFSSPENSDLNRLPLEPFGDTGLITWFTSSTNTKYYSPHIFNDYYDEYLTYLYYDGGGGGYYIKGLGGYYHGNNGFVGTNISELVYFKKDNTEWGTPYDCDDLLNVGITAHTTSTIRIFPNPASDCIRIEGGNENQDFRLYSVAGECVLSGNTGSDSAINISHLASGMYMLGIFTGQAWVNLRVLKL